MPASDPRFIAWVAACRREIERRTGFDGATAQRTIDGAGIENYRRKFDACQTPRQCVDDEFIYWNE